MMGFHGVPHSTPNSIPSSQIGGRSPIQNLFCDWFVNVKRYHFGSSKQIVPNMEDFHGVSHPTASSTPPSNWGDGPPNKNFNCDWLVKVAIDRLDFNRFSERGVGISDDITCDRLIISLLHNLRAAPADNIFYIADGSRVIGLQR